jgi:hypothetical protein
MATEQRRITHGEWFKEAVKRFGTELSEWKFQCPVCGYVASVKDWRDAGAPDDAIAFSCIGRWKTKPNRAFEGGPSDGTDGPCNYAGGGLFRLNPVVVIYENDSERSTFEFAES